MEYRGLCKLVIAFLLLLAATPILAEELRMPEDIIDHGLRASPVLMLNEAHSGNLRCVRTRELGRELLPVMHQLGVRILALEALDESFAKEWNRTRKVRVPGLDLGYISQPDLQALMQSALDLGWQLRGYEAGGVSYSENFAWFTHPSRETIISQRYVQWREDEQARNLLEVYQSRGTSKVLVWCGNGHNRELESQISIEPYFVFTPMGAVFSRISGIDPFTVDQTRTVEWPGSGQSEQAQTELQLRKNELEKLGGHGGYLTPPGSKFDAVILSVHNKFE